MYEIQILSGKTEWCVGEWHNLASDTGESVDAWQADSYIEAEALRDHADQMGWGPTRIVGVMP